MTGKYLELSTCHLSPDTASAMHTFHQLYIFDKDGYGWFVAVPSKEEENLKGIPSDLASVLSYAAKNGCSWIIFDSGAEKIASLEDFTEAWA